MDKFDKDLFIDEEICKSINYMTLYQNDQLINLIKKYLNH